MVKYLQELTTGCNESSKIGKTFESWNPFIVQKDD